MAQQSVVTNDIGRVFFQGTQGLLGCCPEYLGCVGLSGVSQDRGETLTVKCLSDKKSGTYDLLGIYPGELGNITFDMTSYLGLNGTSILRDTFKDGCLSNIHVHFGRCSNPQDFKTFEKAIIIEEALITSYSTDDLISLQSDAKAVVTETVSVEATGMYEYFSEKQFGLVSVIDETDPFEIHLLDGDGCSVCVFCSDCTVQQCQEDFYTIQQDGPYVASFNSISSIYTISANGSIKCWDSESVIGLNTQCSVLTPISLETGETVISAAYNSCTNILAVGTSDGRVIFYNMQTGNQVDQLNLTGGVTATVITANDYGYLVGASNGALYFSETGNIWDGPVTGPGGTFEALLIYSAESWLISTTSGVFYTNDSGDNFTSKNLAALAGNPIKQFAQSNSLILHAINDTVFYQTFDAGCSWKALDLSSYFSELYSIVVCPDNEFVVYVAGLSVDGTQSYILSIGLGT